MGGQAIEQWEEDHEPIHVDDYQGNFSYGKESQIHFEAKLEIQHWINKLIHPTKYGCALAAVEWMYPLNRVKLGRRFCWLEEDRDFCRDQWLEVNERYIPTPYSAIHDWKYTPKFVFDIAVECGELCDVFEITCSNPTDPRKRVFCQDIGIPFYEIDAEKFNPKYGKTEMCGWCNRTYETPRFVLPLLGWGEIDLQDWARDFKRRYP